MKTDKSLHVTQKHIAEALHIDISTVSKALRGDPRIAGKTRASVAAAAERIGYPITPVRLLVPPVWLDNGTL